MEYYMNDIRINALQVAVDQGTATGDFPTSLIEQFTRRGSLSEKQWYWVEKLSNPEPPKVDENIGSMEGIISLFAVAREHLKYPKVWLQFGDNYPLRLNVAGPGSKYRGSIQMTDGLGYDDGTWFGRISPEGDVTFSRGTDETERTELISVLRQLAADPAKVASEYGSLTGNCAFCHKALSDERSTKVGYGKTCAAHFGLTWGDK
jgi:hypothetical protein